MSVRLSREREAAARSSHMSMGSVAARCGCCTWSVRVGAKVRGTWSVLGLGLG